MPIYRIEGTVTLNAEIIIYAEDESTAWAELDDRLRPRLYLAGYSRYVDASGTEIKSTGLSISRA